MLFGLREKERAINLGFFGRKGYRCCFKSEGRGKRELRERLNIQRKQEIITTQENIRYNFLYATKFSVIHKIQKFQPKYKTKYDMQLRLHNK